MQSAPVFARLIQRHFSSMQDFCTGSRYAAGASVASPYAGVDAMPLKLYRLFQFAAKRRQHRGDAIGVSI